MNRRISPVHRHTGLWFVGTFTDAKLAFYIPMIDLMSWLLYSHLRGLVGYKSKCIGMTCVHRHTNYSTLIPHTPLKKKGDSHASDIYTNGGERSCKKFGNRGVKVSSYHHLISARRPHRQEKQSRDQSCDSSDVTTTSTLIGWRTEAPSWVLTNSRKYMFLSPSSTLSRPYLLSPLVYLSLPPPHSYSLDLPPSPSSSSSLPLTIYPSKNLSHSHIFLCHIISFYYFQSSFVYYHSHIN